MSMSLVFLKHLRPNLTMEKLYRIEEYCTTGWELTSEQDVQLTKEEAQRRIRGYLSEGHNPNSIRVSLDA